VLVSGGGFLIWLAATARANNWIRLLKPERETVESLASAPGDSTA
jgi:hypothetical protein